MENFQLILTKDQYNLLRDGSALFSDKQYYIHLLAFKLNRSEIGDKDKYIAERINFSQDLGDNLRETNKRLLEWAQRALVAGLGQYGLSWIDILEGDMNEALDKWQMSFASHEKADIKGNRDIGDIRYEIRKHVHAINDLNMLMYRTMKLEENKN